MGKSKTMTETIIIPKTWGHDREIFNYGIGSASTNSKEYCECSDCLNLRNRRDKIYRSGLIHRLFKLKK